MLSLLHRNNRPEAPPSPSAPSAARQALAQAQARLRAVQEEVERLLLPGHLAEELREEERRAQAELDDAIADESARWDRWARDGARGEMPRPDFERRGELELRLRAATAKREVAEREVERIQPEVRRATAEAERRRQEMIDAVDAVVGDEAARLGERLLAAMHHMVEIENALLGLRAYAMRRGGALLTVVSDALRYGRATSYAEFHADVSTWRGEQAATREAWRALPDRLAGDAAAIVEVSGGDR